jgi:hypothetical protein
VLYCNERLLNAIKPPKHAETGIMLRIGSRIYVNNLARRHKSKRKNVMKKFIVVNVKFGK